MNSRTLFVIEPWVCHFEILPTVIYSAKGLFDEIIVKTLDIREAMKCIKQYATAHKVEWHNLGSNNDSENISGECLVWLNTTHIHGNKISFNYMHNRIKKLLGREECRQLFIVIHNQHDMNWYQNLWVSCRKEEREKMQLIALSEDTYYKYLMEKKGGKIIKVCILEQEKETPKKMPRETIRLCIVGMCREGKKFRSAINYKDLITRDLVEFVYCGWIPSNSLKESGLLEAVTKGAISQVLGSNKRVEDIKMHSFIQNSDAIIDLKIPKGKDNILMSSGNVGLSIALNVPLIAQRANYPSHNCIRYKDYDDLGDILLQKNLREVLQLQRIFLKGYQQDCIERAKRLWISKVQ